MSLPDVGPQVLHFFGTPLVIEPSPGQLSHDTLRQDPVFKLVAGRSPEAHDLASQPTLSRFENAIAILGADDDLAYLVTRLRRAWPDVALHFRGDCGFGLPALYEVCEGLRVWYTFGLSANAVLQRETEGLLAEAVAGYDRERQAARQEEPPRPAAPSRLFTGFWYQAGMWLQPRWVVAKAEANDRGTNRRFVVTNRPGGMVLPGPTYDKYAARGESVAGVPGQSWAATDEALRRGLRGLPGGDTLAGLLDRHRGPRHRRGHWTPEDDALVRTLPPAEATRRTGRTIAAVYERRRGLGVAPAGRWTPAEDDLARTLPVEEAAERTGRTLRAVYRRRPVLARPVRRAGRCRRVRRGQFDGMLTGRRGRKKGAGPIAFGSIIALWL
jgi:hypothetical protein